MGEPLRIGIIGAGKISAQYARMIPRYPGLRVTSVADRVADRAAELAASLPGSRAEPLDALMAAGDVDAVLNLTLPSMHAEIAAAAIAEGKAVYGEKPLAATLVEAREVVALADRAGVRLGCAPDTVLGTGIQTARRAIDDGEIGTPIAATATMLTPGHERWHPDPEFYYQPGGGPLLDMGPYYVTALVTLLGPIVSARGAASRARVQRTIGSGPRAGETFPVEIDTHVTGVLEHASGALSTITTSFDAVATTIAPIEVHGESGSLSVPDPNVFDGTVRLHRLGGDGWHELPTSAGYRDSGRGVGLADLAATPAGEVPRADGTLALHVLDALESLLRSAETGRVERLTTTVARPRAVPLSDGPGA